MLSYPRMKADAGFGSQVEDSAVRPVEQVQPCCTILPPWQGETVRTEATSHFLFLKRITSTTFMPGVHTTPEFWAPKRENLLTDSYL